MLTSSSISRMRGGDSFRAMGPPRITWMGGVRHRDESAWPWPFFRARGPASTTPAEVEQQEGDEPDRQGTPGQDHHEPLVPPVALVAVDVPGRALTQPAHGQRGRQQPGEYSGRERR